VDTYSVRACDFVSLSGLFECNFGSQGDRGTDNIQLILTNLAYIVYIFI